MSDTNPRWGAPRIHGELLKLGIDVSQATVAKYSELIGLDSHILMRELTPRRKEDPCLPKSWLFTRLF
jgi:hypothetical protein